MDCPSCGHANASDRLECQRCEALLVDVFDSENVKTDPEPMLRASPTQSRSDSGDVRERIAATQYTGDLPRLFRFGDRYQILEKVGEGGMGRVYKALDLELDRPVALKTIRAERTGQEVIKRFKQELILARKITHKNVVRIYDLGEAEGMKFFTMELIEGESLREILTEKKSIPPKEVIGYMKQILSGLSEAHSQGVVHRDLKPQNIMLDALGQVRIMDFGIARTADTATLTGTSEMVGTPDYISPEQVKGENADAQSDLYSFGVILYELLTGEVPFKGETAISKVVARIQTKPPSPRSLNAEIPGYLERMIEKLMEVDPDLRYKTAEEVLQDLEREQVDRSLLLRGRKAVARHGSRIAAVVLTASIGIGYWYYRTRPTVGANDAVVTTTLAVLPIHNRTGAEALGWMELGIPEMLVTDISQSRALRPVLSTRVNRILSDLGKSGEARFDDETLAVISRMAGASYVLHGSFTASGGRLRADLVLRDTATGVSTPLQVEGTADDVFSLVDDITDRVATELNDTTRDNRPIEDFAGNLPAFRAYHQGLRELANGSIQSAVPLLQRAIALNDGFAMAHARLADAYFRAEMYAEAKAAIARAESLSSDSKLPIGERYQIHAISAQIHDDPETASRSYRKLSELYPDDPDILNSLASALETDGQYGEAAGIYGKVIELAPGHGAALLGLGRTLVLRDLSAEAIPYLDQAVASGRFEGDDETLGMLHIILGVAHRNTRNYLKAVEHFEISLEHRRRAEDTRGVIASLVQNSVAQRELGRWQDATDSLTMAIAAAREAQMPSMESAALLSFGNLALEARDFEQALLHYRTSLDIELELGQNLEVIYRLDAMAEVYRLLGQYVDALIYLDLAATRLEGADEPAEAAFNQSVRGLILRERGRYDDAAEALLSAVPVLEQTHRSRDLDAAWHALTDIYMEQGRFSEALGQVERAVSYFENASPSHLANAKTQYASILVELGAYEEADETLAEAKVLFPGSETSAYYDLVLGRRKLYTGEVDAERILSSAVSKADRERQSFRGARARIQLAVCLIRAGKTERAQGLLQNTLDEARASRSRVIEAEALAALGELELARRAGSARWTLQQAGEQAAQFQGRLLQLRVHGLVERTRAADEASSNEYRDILAWVNNRVPERLRASFENKTAGEKTKGGIPSDAASN